MSSGMGSGVQKELDGRLKEIPKLGAAQCSFSCQYLGVG